jgi:hypothetical protein
MKTARAVVLVPLCIVLQACQSSKEPETAASPAGGALPVMERVALGARECWFRSKDTDFAKYRLSPELTSMTGKPRILIVPARNPNGLPLAVIEAQGNPARLSAFGPLMDGALAPRIRADVNRWASGSEACASAG